MVTHYMYIPYGIIHAPNPGTGALVLSSTGSYSNIRTYSAHIVPGPVNAAYSGSTEHTVGTEQTVEIEANDGLTRGYYAVKIVSLYSRTQGASAMCGYHRIDITEPHVQQAHSRGINLWGTDTTSDMDDTEKTYAPAPAFSYQLPTMFVEHAFNSVDIASHSEEWPQSAKYCESQGATSSRTLSTETSLDFSVPNLGYTMTIGGKWSESATSAGSIQYKYCYGIVSYDTVWERGTINHAGPSAPPTDIAALNFKASYDTSS